MVQLEELRSLAQLAEQAQRYDDMCKFSKQIIKKTPEITENDRKLFATAFRCKISQRRTAWRAVSALLYKETQAINKPTIMFFKQNLEKEIRQICGQVIEIVSQLIAKRSEKNIVDKDKEKQKLQIRNKLQFYKIKGDYLRYLCEIGKQSEMKSLKEDCEKAYKQAIKLLDMATIKDSMKIDPLKLGICLNYSVFHYQVNNSIQDAIDICQKSFNEALEAVSDLQDTRFTDLVTILQLMHDNITAWKIEAQKSVR